MVGGNFIFNSAGQKALVHFNVCFLSFGLFMFDNSSFFYNYETWASKAFFTSFVMMAGIKMNFLSFPKFGCLRLFMYFRELCSCTGGCTPFVRERCASHGCER